MLVLGASGEIYQQLLNGGVAEDTALSIAGNIAGKLGAIKKDKNATPVQNLDIEQLVHISPEEREKISLLVGELIAAQREPKEDELNIKQLLGEQAQGVDIALFGRMLASNPEFNVEAAAKVAHALGSVQWRWKRISSRRSTILIVKKKMPVRRIWGSRACIRVVV